MTAKDRWATRALCPGSWAMSYTSLAGLLYSSIPLRSDEHRSTGQLSFQLSLVEDDGLPGI